MPSVELFFFVGEAQVSEGQAKTYRVVERLGWSYIEGEPPTPDTGPWRYRWEAQEHCDRLNANANPPEPPMTEGRAKLERERSKRVARAEARAGIVEGVYVLRGAECEHVRISVEFYPKEHWVIEDINIIGGAAIPGTSRPLTDAVKVKLESWL